MLLRFLVASSTVNIFYPQLNPYWCNDKLSLIPHRDRKSNQEGREREKTISKGAFVACHTMERRQGLPRLSANCVTSTVPDAACISSAVGRSYPAVHDGV